MAWVKIDDQFTDHPKVVAVGPVAGWLYLCGLTYCSRFLTDGHIPAAQVRRLADVKNPDRLAAALVEAGLWESCDGGYRVHDYLDYNPSRERVLQTRAVRADAGSRGGKQKASNLLDDGYAGATNNDAEMLKQNPTPSRTPTRTPINQPVKGSASERPGRDAPSDAGTAPVPRLEKPKQTTVPDGFVPSERGMEWAEKSWPPEFVRAETEKFVDHFRGTGGKKSDWEAAWRNWMRRAEDMAPKGRSGTGPAGRYSSRTEEARRTLDGFLRIARGEEEG